MGRFDYRGVEETASALVAISRELKGNPSPEKEGGYLTVVPSGFSEGVHVLEIGSFPEEKYDKYRSLSAEKASRVFANWLRAPFNERSRDDVVSSYQTRDPDLNMWGGAVVFDSRTNFEVVRYPNIVSFSGLSELADEALSYVIGRSLHYGEGPDLLQKIKDTSGNELIDEMIGRFSKL